MQKALSAVGELQYLVKPPFTLLKILLCLLNHKEKTCLQYKCNKTCSDLSKTQTRKNLALFMDFCFTVFGCLRPLHDLTV